MLPGIPLLDLTATVQISERTKLIKACGMVQPMIVDVSPNKENISFNFIPVVIEKEAVTCLKWIGDMVAAKGKETPQTIIFCNTFNDISTVLSYLLLILKERLSLKKVIVKKNLFLEFIMQNPGTRKKWLLTKISNQMGSSALSLPPVHLVWA